MIESFITALGPMSQPSPMRVLPLDNDPRLQNGVHAHLHRGVQEGACRVYEGDSILHKMLPGSLKDGSSDPRQVSAIINAQCFVRTNRCNTFHGKAVAGSAINQGGYVALPVMCRLEGPERGPEPVGAEAIGPTADLVRG